jgi:hypothetical protein
MGFSIFETRRPDFLFIGIALCALGLFFSFKGATELYGAYRLNGAAALASGTVDRLYTSGKGGSYYHVSYSFPVGGRTVNSSGSAVSKANWEHLQASGTIPVRYLNDDPTFSEPDLPGERGLTLRTACFSTFIPTIFVGFGIYTALFSRKGYAGWERGDRPD